MPVITAKFASQCPLCRQPIAAGSKINWERGQKATHTDCEGTVLTAPETQSAVITRTWSPLQLDVFKAVLSEDSGNIIVGAAPGSGKTTTSVEAAIRVKIAHPDASVVMCAFNASIAGELKTRVPAGVEATTFHSLWFRALQRQFNRMNVDKNKTRKLTNDLIKRGQLDRYTVDQYLAGALKLVSVAKSAGIGICVPDEIDTWIDLMDRFEVEFDGASTFDGINLAQRLLSLSNEDTNTIDFDDMLYLSALNNVQCQRYEYVFVDEAQDFSPLQLHLLRRMIAVGGKLVAVGDEFQSIYSFRSADSDSMARIAEVFNCTELPLNVSYRCSRAVVEHARENNPYIEAAPNAPEGAVVRHTTWTLTDFLPTDAVLCRNTAPLVTLAYRCIAQRVPVKMTGREIGDGLVSLINKMHAVDLDDLQTRLSDYANVEVTRLNKRMQEDKAEALQDRIDSINTAISNLDADDRTIEALIAEIEDLFTPKAEGMLTLSTVHRAKGAEFPRVFILNAQLMPSKCAKTGEQMQQERNIINVARTRAILETHYIDSQALV